MSGKNGKTPEPEFITTPFTVIVDTREQAPYAFTGIRSDAVTGRKPIAVQTRRAGLPSGDYSIEGFESRIAVERKSLNDLFSTLGQHRRRFQEELERLAVMEFATVVVEAEWSIIIECPPSRSLLNPKTVFRSVIAWQQRFPVIHWQLCPGRAFAEVMTFRVLERFWKNDQLKKKKQKANEAKIATAANEATTIAIIPEI